MQVKQILIAFWWIIALAVIIIFGLKIHSLKFEVTPTDTTTELALLIDRMSTMNMKANLTYFLDKDVEIRMSNGNVIYLSKGVVLERYPFVGSDLIHVTSEKGRLILQKNE